MSFVYIPCLNMSNPAMLPFNGAKKMEPTQHPPFYRVPAEICSLILKESLRIDKLESLKHLRLVSRHFAHLPALLSELFERIVLVVSPAHLLDAFTIAPHIKHITFLPHKYAWGMTLDLFREILFYEPVTEFVMRNRSDEPGINELLRYGQSESPLGFVNNYMNGEAPFTETCLKMGFDEYMEQANKTRELYESGKMATSWIRMMSSMPAGASFKIGQWIFNGHPEGAWKERGCVLHMHAHTKNGTEHSYDKCRMIHGAVGEKLFDTVLACLIASKVRVEGLYIYHCVQGRSQRSFAWAHDGRLHRLDLSNLKVLHFCPDVPRLEPIDDWRLPHMDELRPHETNNGRPWKLPTVVTNLVKRAASSLREVNLFYKRDAVYTSDRYDTCLAWPSSTSDLVALPKLEVLHTDACPPLVLFAHVIRGAPQLKQLGFGGEHLVGNWRLFWRAIRYHPSRMEISSQDLEVQEDNFLSMKHDTGRESTSPSMGHPNDPEPTMNINLENYLSNLAPWTGTCRRVFEGAPEWVDEDGTETDEEEKEYWKGKDNGRKVEPGKTDRDMFYGIYGYQFGPEHMDVDEAEGEDEDVDMDEG